MFNGIRMWAYAIGSALFGGLILYAKMLKKQRDAARRRGDILDAGRKANRKKESKIKEEEEVTTSRRAKLIRDIKENKDEEFKGSDNLSDSNSDW